MLQGFIGMHDADMLEAVVLALLAGPEKQRNVHHTVDNRPTGIVVAVPGADESAGNVRTR
ncbi:hypothetical protein D3C87_2089660 [compost metagenome]